MKLRNKKTDLKGTLTLIDFNIDDDETEIDLSIYLDKTDGKCIDKQFYSLDEFKDYLNDWEEYNPKEPLINDERIRKILRDWAKLNNIGSVVILDAKSHIIVRSRIGISYDLEFNYDYKADFKNIEFGESYAIEELCGSEEQWTM